MSYMGNPKPYRQQRSGCQFPCRKIIVVPKEHVGGVEHVIAICPHDSEASQVAQSKDCTLLRCKSKEEVSASHTASRIYKL